MKHGLLIHNIGLLATPKGIGPQAGEDQGKIHFLQDAWILSQDGIIVELGTGKPPQVDAPVTALDAGGRLCTPGLVDSHTHLVFGGWRQNELARKLHGESYLDILASGGGILSTVQATRAASLQELTDKAKDALDQMLSTGTTTCEAKSGYGLDLDTEVRQLTAIQQLTEHHPIDLVPTFLGAHAVPQEYAQDRDGYLDLLCETIIPHVGSSKLAAFCDVFCEEGVFTAEESRRILSAGLVAGMKPKIHTDEIRDIGGTRVAEDLQAISAEHLICCSEEGIDALAKGGTIACLLPATSLYLGADFAPARDMIQAGIPVALGSDYNPGSCPCHNLLLVMTLGCLRYRMTPEEVLTAVTLNGAAALDQGALLGSLEPGKQADILLWDAPDLNYICYRLGADLVHTVIKKGTIALCKN